MRIVAATGNQHKIRELSAVAAEFGVEIIAPQEVVATKNLSPLAPPEEDGVTYLDNARIKARAYASWAGMAAVGDDSGLEVEALGNRPGVLSARYLGPSATDSERCEGILTELADLERKEGPTISRRAFFRCGLVLCVPGAGEWEAIGALGGEILHKPRGSGGFGYDPIVHIALFDRTLAEIDFALTCMHGFRGQALRSLLSPKARKT